MNKFDLILRNIVFFLFPIPFLLGFAIENYKDWTAYVAYAAIVVLVLAAVWRLALEEARRGRRRNATFTVAILVAIVVVGALMLASTDAAHITDPSPPQPC